MFDVAASERISAPIEPLLDLFSYRPAEWLTAFLRLSAYEADAAARMPSEPGRPPRRMSSLRVMLGEPSHDAAGGARIPVAWTAPGGDSIFGSLSGSFVLTPAGLETLITVHGRFEPPRAFDGRAVDAATALDAVRLGIRRFLGHLKSAVEEQARV